MLPRVKFMRLHPSWYVEMCKGTETRKSRPIAHALPDDAELVDAKVTAMGEVLLVIQSASYPEQNRDERMTEQAPTVFEVVTNRDDGLPPRVGALVDEMKRLADAIATREHTPEASAQELTMIADRLAAMAPRHVH